VPPPPPPLQQSPQSLQRYYAPASINDRISRRIQETLALVSRPGSALSQPHAQRQHALIETQAPAPPAADNKRP
jgi:hypothetical protein